LELNLVRRGQEQATNNRILVWLLVLLTLLAFGLRVYGLDRRSLWTDEGLSVYRARQDVAGILSGEIVIQGTASQDTQPPLYFLLLHLQRQLVGENGFGLKFLSAAWGVLAVPLFYVLGRRLLSASAGLVTALLGCTSPLYLWYSQEMRMYPMLVSLSTASVYALLRALGVGKDGRNRWWWLVYLLLTAAALYTHYTAFFLLGFEVAAALGLAIWQRRRGALAFVGLAVVAGVPLLPYALWRLRFVREADYYFVPLPTIANSLFGAFATGFTSQLPNLALIHLGLLVPFLIGLIWLPASAKMERWGRSAFLVGWLALPTLALFAISIYKPLFQGPRHLIIVSPAFYLALASGIVALGRRCSLVGALALVGVLGAILPSWGPFYRSGTFLKDDWRGLAAYVERHAQPADAMLLNDAVLLNVFDYYLSDNFPLTALPPFGHPADGKTVTTLERMTKQYRRIWFVPQRPADGRDDDRLVAHWLKANLTPVTKANFHGLDTAVVVYCFATSSPQVATVPDSVMRLSATWGNDLLLQGYEAAGEVASGGIWRPVFYWSKLRPEASRYVLSLRLTDDQGKAWGQSDEALWQDFPPDVWPMEAIIRHEHEVELPAGLPPGKYQVWLRIVGAKDDQPLSVSSGGADLLLMPNLRVKSAASGVDEALLPPHTAKPAHLGQEIELLGHHIREGDHRPGHLLYVDLYWRVKKPPLADYRLRLQLVDKAGQVVGETVTTPTRAEHPSSHWQPGELLSGKAELLIPPQTEAGAHQVHVSLIHPETGTPLKVRTGWWPFGQETLMLEQVKVVEWPMVTEIPPLQTPLRADFGDPVLVELHGYDLAASHGSAGQHLTLTLFWRARTRMETSYTVFVHLADADEWMAGQGDGVPAQGFRLTTSWRDGEVITDTHTVAIRSDATTGAYRLWVGLYDPESDQRLPAFVDGEQKPADRVLLSNVQVIP
jgi:4-amino-4-deoxy-L-arabinose transferase-like glycosyltransferase